MTYTLAEGSEKAVRLRISQAPFDAEGFASTGALLAHFPTALVLCARVTCLQVLAYGEQYQKVSRDRLLGVSPSHRGYVRRS